jgi:hypothetical protein
MSWTDGLALSGTKLTLIQFGAAIVILYLMNQTYNNLVTGNLVQGGTYLIAFIIVGVITKKYL